MPNSISSPRETSFAGATDTSAPLLFPNSRSEPGPVRIGGEYLRDDDERDPVRDIVSACAESPVEASRDPYADAAAAGVSSLVFAVEDSLGAALAAFRA